MANTRMYDEVDGLKFIGVVTPGGDVLVGGVTTIETTQAYVDEFDDISDSVQGVDHTVEAGQRISCSLTTTDVGQGIELLIGDFASAEWFGREATSALYGQGTLVRPKCHSLSFSGSRSEAATITIEAEIEFPTATAAFNDVEGLAAGVAAPTFTQPLSQWQPQTAIHGSLTAMNLQGMNFRLATQGVLLDRNGADVGITSVAIRPFGIVGVDLTFRDTDPQAAPAPPHDFATAMMLNGMADLVVAFLGIGDTPDKTLTIRNVKFRSKKKAAGRDWTGFTLSGVAQFKDPTGAPPVIRTLDDATAANRMIDWA